MKLDTSTRKKFRVRKKLKKVASKNRFRLSISRSSRNIFAQIIDDNKKITLVSASSKEKNIEKMPKSKVSEVVGKLIAERSVKKGVKEVYFDRGKYKYHGRIKLLAETARKEGLKF